MGPSNPTLTWQGDVDGYVSMIDQTLLPQELLYVAIRDKEAMWDAIQRLVIRGAPAIGVAAAYGVVLGAQEFEGSDVHRFQEHVRSVMDYLATSRPTAVNLFWALERMNTRLKTLDDQDPRDQKAALFHESCLIHQEDEAICAELGRVGAQLVESGDILLTHCNAGALATGGSGTALSVMFHAHEEGRRFRVFVDETRPLLQGSRLTAWELMQAGINATLICDNMAAHAMKTQGITRIFVGADRIAANGDACNKIGTYGVAVAAQAHNIPFYVVAPKSTFDLSLSTGAEIPIEERASEEITAFYGHTCAPQGVQTWSPAFDVTPHQLITGIVTEKGLISPLSPETIEETLNS